ncbi:MAG: alpha/beta hydrolase [Deltaproteobacteria bacterium]|nr:alpha/beta hydrolase [Deltaproteobacteria bacterium]
MYTAVNMVFVFVCALAAISLLLLLLVLAASYSKGTYHASRPYDQVHFIFTRDDFRLALSRYTAKDVPRGLPVVLCHGLGANAASMDLGPERSLAQYLSQAGRDTWMLELRGCGLSRATGDWRKKTWSFDEFVRNDVPAALEKVINVSSSPAIHFVGHSMGGMIIYAYLQAFQDKRIQSIVAIASPSAITHVDRFKPLFRLLANRSRPIRQIGLARTAALFAGRLPLPFTRVLVNPKNISPKAMRIALCNLPANIAGGVAAQFAWWSQKGSITSASSDLLYSFDETGMAKITVPALLLAGTADLLAPVQSVERAFNMLGSKDKQMLIPGVNTSESEGFGHGDILIGDSARYEVFPGILKWLDSHDDLEDSHHTPGRSAPQDGQ